MTAAQPDKLREALAEALATADTTWTPDPLLGDREFWGHYADALLPVVTAWADSQARARAAEELRAAADRIPRFSPPIIAKWLRDRAAALTADDQPGQL